MSKQHCRTLQVERFFRQCRMLLRQSRTLLRHCCWCGPGLTCRRDWWVGCDVRQTAAGRGVAVVRRRRAAEDETASQSDQLHDGPAVRTGAALRRDPLPGRVYEGRAESETRAQRGSDTGVHRHHRHHQHHRAVVE